MAIINAKSTKMKKITIPLLAYAIASIQLIGQQPQQQSGSASERFEYYAENDIVAYYYDILRNKVDSNTMRILKPGVRFRKISEIKRKSADQESEKFTIIQVIEFDTTAFKDSAAINNMKREATLAHRVSFVENDKYLIVATATLEDSEKVSKWYSTRRKSGNNHLNLGTLFLPFKIRPGFGSADFSFNADVSLGGVFGWNFRVHHFKPYYMGPIAYVGTSLISVDSSTTRGLIKQNNYLTGSITSCIGGIIELDKFQIAVIVGMDFIPGKIGQNWMFTNLPWFTLGFGYQFIQRKDTK